MAHLFEHNGIAYSPDGATKVAAEDVEEHNAAQDAIDVAHAATKPERIVAYYVIIRNKDGNPSLSSAAVITWGGAGLGRITSARVYTHNFGGRFVALTAEINGQTYYGRASWDNGTYINLRRASR